MGNHAQRTAAQLLAASIAEQLVRPRREPIATEWPVPSRRRKRGALEADDSAAAFARMAQAVESNWTQLDEDDDEGSFVDMDFRIDAAPPSVTVAPSVVAPAPRSATVIVSVVGNERIEALLGRSDPARGLTFRSSHTENILRARNTIEALLPDLILVDLDVRHASDLVVTLLDDPKTDGVPIVVVGTFEAKEDRARYLALGCAGAFAKPITDPAALRHACADAVAKHISLTSPVAPAVAPIIAPVANVSTASTIVMSETPPPVNPYAMVTVLKSAIAAELPSLAGRRVLVADADPAVLWFLGDAFRKAGCIVEEFLQADKALRALARTTLPDLVVVEAPSCAGAINGIALCQAIRKDIAARDIPVLLLASSDEPNADIARSSANAVVSKGASVDIVLAKARELIASRTELEERFRLEPQISGTLHGITVRTLLASTVETHPRATIRLDDGAFVHTIVLEHGRVARVMRTAPDGHVEVGLRAMATALAVRRAKYTVTPCESRDEDDGSDLLADALAALRTTSKTIASPRQPDAPDLEIDPDAALWLAAQDGRRAVSRRIEANTLADRHGTTGFASKTYADAVVEELCSRGFVLGPRVAKLALPSGKHGSEAADAVAPSAPPSSRASAVPAPAATAASSVRAPARVRAAAFVSAAVSEGAAAAAVTATPAPAAPPVRVIDDATDVDGVTYGPKAPIEPIAPMVQMPGYEAPAPRQGATPIAAQALAAVSARRPRLLRSGGLAALAVLAIALGSGARWKMRTGTHPAPVAASVVAAAASPASGPASASTDKPPIVLPPEGTVEISTAPDASIVIDGVERGHGPKLSITLSSGTHEVRAGAGSQPRTIQILRGRVTHVDLVGVTGASGAAAGAGGANAFGADTLNGAPGLKGIGAAELLSPTATKLP